VIVTTSRDFQCNGRHLSVRAAAADGGWRVRVYEGDRAVTATAYAITHDSAVDAPMASMHLVHELMTLAQSDVEEGRVRLVT
jgi:hypothetical protein